MQTVKISVVVPTYNRLSSLKRLITGLETQTFPAEDFEVVIVSDGSNDGTDQYLKQLQTHFRLVSVSQKNEGPAAARNRGVENAQGDIILFLDDDILPAPQLIAEHYRVLTEHDQNLIVLGPMVTPKDFELSPWVEWEQNMLVKQYEAIQFNLWQPTARQFYTGNSSVYRCHLLTSRGFDPTFKRAEDVELAYRLEKDGLRFTFNPQAIGYHYAQRSFSTWMAIAYAYGENDVKFHQVKGQTWLLPTVKKEFYQRHLFIRILCSLCVDRPWLAKLAIVLMQQAVGACHRLRLRRVTSMALSGIYNLRYYQGIADQLGGWKKLFQEHN